MADVKARRIPGNEYLWDEYDPESLLDTPEKRRREALIRLTIRGFRGREQQIDAIVDSGYTGWLKLPPTVITALDLQWQSLGRGVLADGSVSVFDVYRAKAVWDDRIRSVFVDEFDATPLLGMALLQGYEYKMQVRARGKVTIKRLLRR